MIEELQKRVAGLPGREAKLNSLREYLQVLSLKVLYDNGRFRSVAFVGGTALRILFGLRRFSEDLDFCRLESGTYNFPSLISELAAGFRKFGLDVQTRMGDAKRRKSSVDSCLLKFTGLADRLDLGGPSGQKLAIRFEVDANPPEGWETAVTPLADPFVFAVTHYDLPSLFASKLHACLFRPYLKGRDYYDLMWYLGRKIKPNLVLLNNAARQTEKNPPDIGAKTLPGLFRKRLETAGRDNLKKDIERFVEDKSELKVLDPELIMAAVSGAVWE